MIELDQRGCRDTLCLGEGSLYTCAERTRTLAEDDHGGLNSLFDERLNISGKYSCRGNAGLRDAGENPRTQNTSHRSNLIMAVLVCRINYFGLSPLIKAALSLGCLRAGSEFAPQTTGNGRGGGAF